MTDPGLYPCFLGPYGENDGLLEKLVVEFLRDHVYWRRNFHPEDPPAVPTSAALQPTFQTFEARLRRELHALSAALKRSVPFHSPRYLGHMVSDLLLPGLVAQILTLPYNPNNVSEDAAPVTVDMEIQVGLQLARMFGFPHDPALPHCALGHLTSGGTVANFQGLRLALALKAFPVALRAAAPPELEVSADDWSAFNLHPRAATVLYVRWQTWLARQDLDVRVQWQQRVEAERIETLGHVAFFARHQELRPPVVLAPVTAHYSWSKGMKLLGLGREQLREIGESGMRIDLDDLEAQLARAAAERQPVLLCVAVLGTTEFGTIDPIHGVIAARERWALRGLGFAVHVDAAWGGYLATLFRETDGSLRPAAAIRSEFQRFPSSATHAAFAAVADSDSVTVDPHKLGYLPYGAGAFVCRDHRPIELLAEAADYVFDARATPDYLSRYRRLGRFIPEGSKSGAIAAAVYVTHRVLPLDHLHFGRLPRETVRAAEAFVEAAQRFAQRSAGRVRVCLPFAADSNLVCVALNPLDNRSVAAANAFVRGLHERLRCDPSKPLQLREFFGSTTTLHPRSLGAEDSERLLAALDLDRGEWNSRTCESLLILRHTLMNPFLIDAENGISYIEAYFDYLLRLLEECPARPARLM